MSQYANIDEYFNKSFEFTGNDSWTLPKKAYDSPPWSIDALQQMKIELNMVKGQLSKFPLSSWSKHTKRTDPSSLVKYTIGMKTRIELLTQAWCKFYECLNMYRVVPECTNRETLYSLHLCEAPGAFISALNHYLFINHANIKWTWNANTLNPYYEGNNLSEMIIDDSLIDQTIANWEFGKDQTGDICKFYNHQDLVGKFSNVDLITADGSINCMDDPGEQEHNVHHLHYCEVITALKVLCRGGNFVLKLFTMYEHGTVCLMYLLNCCFKNVQVFKPCSSKSGNSEVYVMCFSYRGFNILSELWDSLTSSYKTVKEEAMFDLSEINANFLMQLENCAKYFMELQCSRINQNIELFTEDSSTETWNCVKDIQEKVANAYLVKCHVTGVPKDRKLIKNPRKKPRVIHRELDLTVTSRYRDLCDNNLIKLKIGQAVDVVHSCWFGYTSTKLFRGENTLPECVTPTCIIINSALFDTGISQCDLHRRFLNLILERTRRCRDLAICGVPLLTRFLVGVVYILSLGFTSFVVCKGGVVFRTCDKYKFYIVRKHLEEIMFVYDHLKSKDFVEDILEVVPMKLLRRSNFHRAIFKYNNEICM